MNKFDLKNKTLIKSCKPILHTLYTTYRKKYIDLFFYEKDIDFKNIHVEPLLQTKILRKIGKRFRANVQIFPLSGKFICTDFLFSIHRIKQGRFVRRKDDVWAIFAYESPYIVKKAIVKKGDVVLDLATGSGMIAIFCADKAKKVIATDINSKAINYAKFNAILNNVEDKIEFKVGDLFNPVANMKFDLIIWNGPTISVPDAPDKYPIYCFGGLDGLQFTRKFIEQAPKYLTKKGKMQWLDPSVGSLDQPKSMKIIREKWKNKKFKVVYEQRTQPSNLFKTIEYVDKRMILEPLKGPKKPLWIKPISEKEYTGWLEFLRKSNYSHIHAGMYKIYPNNKFKIIITKPKEILFKRMNQFPQEWHFLGYQRILQLLKICESY